MGGKMSESALDGASRSLRFGASAFVRAQRVRARALLAGHGLLLTRYALLYPWVPFGSCLFLSRASSVSSGVSLLTHLTHSPLQQRTPTTATCSSSA